MRKLLLLIFSGLLVSCAPGLKDVEEMVKDDVNNLLIENNSDECSLKMLDFTLDTKCVDGLTYTGFVNAEVTYQTINPYFDDFYDVQYEESVESEKVFYTVKIKFHDKKYEEYSIYLE